MTMRLITSRQFHRHVAGEFKNGLYGQNDATEHQILSGILGFNDLWDEWAERYHYITAERSRNKKTTRCNITLYLLQLLTLGSLLPCFESNNFGRVQPTSILSMTSFQRMDIRKVFVPHSYFKCFLCDAHSPSTKRNTSLPDLPSPSNSPHPPKKNHTHHLRLANDLGSLEDRAYKEKLEIETRILKVLKVPSVAVILPRLVGFDCDRNGCFGCFVSKWGMFQRIWSNI